MSATEDIRTLEGFDSVEVAGQIAESLHRLSRDATGSELVYAPFSRHSYYRDLMAVETGRIQSPGGEERLKRHAEQMDQLAKEREALVWRQLRDGFEYRVAPDRTDGFGGYFAPPAWLNQLFATANRPGRVLAGLMVRFALPSGVSSINLPIIGTGASVLPEADDSAVPEQDITDSAGSSAVVPLAGQVDVALQLLEQSPAGAHTDWAIFQDLTEATDAELETQLVVGLDGATSNPGTAQLLGVTNVANIISVAYTAGSPTGSGMWTPLSKVPAQIGDARSRPPECWLMRTARWAWLQGAEDGTSNRPFGLSTRFFLGSDDDTPDPVSGLMGWPVFLDDAIPATLGAGANQDVIICLRPRDMILLEGTPQSGVFREPLSGSLGARVQMHTNVAAITGRRPAGIGVLQGTGMAVQSGY